MKILGISLGHDSGASIISNGVLKVASNEERLSRKKFFHIKFLHCFVGVDLGTDLHFCWEQFGVHRYILY